MGDPRSYHWENGIQVSSVTFKFFSTIAESLCPFFFTSLLCALHDRVRRNEPTARGIVEFDDNSTIALSSVNFQ